MGADLLKPRAWLAAMLFSLGPTMAGTPAGAPVKPQLSPVDVQSLLQGRTVAIGSVNSIELAATLETLEGKGGLSYLEGKAVNGLVVSIFVDQEADPRDLSHVKPGVLFRTIADRLKIVAPDAHRKFEDLLNQFIPAKTGDVAGFDLNLPSKARESFPIDRVIVVVFAMGRSNESTEFLDSAFAAVIADARKARLDTLVVPCIGHQWMDKNSLTFDDLFRAFFRTLDRSSGPLRISLSLYSGWPSFVVQDAVATLNREARAR
jgi:hypothetical protein